MVLPVTVKQSPCNIPCASIYFKTPGTPPTLCKSSIKYLPEGFKSARNGVVSLICWKSFKVNSICAAFAIAKKCSTALVEPPNTVTNRTAFSSDLRVTISDGLISFSMRCLSAAPTRAHSAVLLVETAGLELVYGKLIPKASMALAIVFAVYIPPQAPAPGQAFFTTVLNSFSVIVPATFSPQASKAETTSSFLSS